MSKPKLRAFVEDLVAHATRVMTARLGVDSDAALQAGTEIARRVCEQYARTYMYVPTTDDFERAARNAQIWQLYGEGPFKYTHRRVDELAAQFELTPQQVYNIVRKMQRAAVAERQGVLPGLESADT